MTTKTKSNGHAYQWFPDPDATMALEVEVGGGQDVITLQVRGDMTVEERDVFQDIWKPGRSPAVQKQESMVRVIKSWTLTYPGQPDNKVPITIESLRAMDTHGFDAIWQALDPHLITLTNLQAKLSFADVNTVWKLLRRAHATLPDLTDDDLRAAVRTQYPTTEDGRDQDPPKPSAIASG